MIVQRIIGVLKSNSLRIAASTSTSFDSHLFFLVMGEESALLVLIALCGEETFLHFAVISVQGKGPGVMFTVRGG